MHEVALDSDGFHSRSAAQYNRDISRPHTKGSGQKSTELGVGGTIDRRCGNSDAQVVAIGVSNLSLPRSRHDPDPQRHTMSVCGAPGRMSTLGHLGDRSLRMCPLLAELFSSIMPSV